MKLSLFLLPIATTAFAPVSRLSSRGVSSSTLVVTRNEIDTVCEKITDTTEDVLAKADSLVLSRAMRFADHVPMLLTLKCLADKAGMAVTRSSITAAPKSFTGLTTALPVPAWCFNVWAVAAIIQIASMAKSALATGGNELSQADITATAVANVAAMRAIASSNPLLDTGITAIASGYALRAQSGDGAPVTIHKAALQLVTSFTTVLTILGLLSAATAKLTFLPADSVTPLLGLVALRVLSRRGPNGTVRQAVHAGVLGGLVYDRIVTVGIATTLEVSSVVSGVTTLGAAVVAFQAINRLRKTLMQ